MRDPVFTRSTKFERVRSRVAANVERTLQRLDSASLHRGDESANHLPALSIIIVLARRFDPSAEQKKQPAVIESDGVLQEPTRHHKLAVEVFRVARSAEEFDFQPEHAAMSILTGK